jgi:hypothetical protein
MKLKIVCKLIADKAGDGCHGYVSIRHTFRLWRFPKVIHFTLRTGPIADTLTFKVRPNDEVPYAQTLLARANALVRGLPIEGARSLKHRHGKRKIALLTLAYDAIRNALSHSLDCKASNRTYDPMNEVVWRIALPDHGMMRALRLALRPGAMP